MKKIILIVGARPNFIKAYPIYKVLKNDFELTLIHTGQHFNTKMSDVFFFQLGFPIPNINLNLSSRSRAGEYDNKLYVNNLEYLNNKSQAIKELMDTDGNILGQLGEIRDKLSIEFKKICPDLVMVFGDITSTLAASLAAKKLSVDIAHVESGLRSGDLTMPEEVNRILTDHISKYYFVTEPSGISNLKNEGIVENVYLVGNTMIDCLYMFKNKALDTRYYEKLGIKEKTYVLVTLHRPRNVDDLDKLAEIFEQLFKLSHTEKLVYPIHPRTKSNLKKIGYLEKINANKNIILEEPLGYFEFICLEFNSKYVITDSGGIQEETTALGIPCFTLRPNTERPITLVENGGTNQLVNSLDEIKFKEFKGKINLWNGLNYNNIFNIIINI
jgi:UDP-N-acetylglucosamine 2-epimerase (non-hydrolysing)